MPYGQRESSRKRSESDSSASQREEKARVDEESARLVEHNARVAEQLVAQASEQRAENDARVQRLVAELREGNGKKLAALATREAVRMADSGAKPGPLHWWEHHKPSHPSWYQKGGALDAAVYGAVAPLFRPPVGSPAWAREYPEEAAAVRRDALAVVEKDRAKSVFQSLRGDKPAGRTGDALGPLPPSFDPEVRMERDIAAARLARGDRTGAAIDEYKSSQETLTAIEDQSRRDWALIGSGNGAQGVTFGMLRTC